MTKSSLRKDQEKSVTTNLSIGWEDAIAVGADVAEFGAAIYVVPRKGEAVFQRMLWTYFINQDPADIRTFFAVHLQRDLSTNLGLERVAFAQSAIIVAKQVWRSITAIGLIKVSETIEVDMKEKTMSRRSNLQEDNDFTIVPSYLSEQSINVGQTGILWVKETLMQDNFRDDLDEWAGYTFEESAS